MKVERKNLWDTFKAVRKLNDYINTIKNKCSTFLTLNI